MRWLSQLGNARERVDLTAWMLLTFASGKGTLANETKGDVAENRDVYLDIKLNWFGKVFATTRYPGTLRRATVMAATAPSGSVDPDTLYTKQNCIGGGSFGKVYKGSVSLFVGLLKPLWHPS